MNPNHFGTEQELTSHILQAKTSLQIKVHLLFWKYMAITTFYSNCDTKQFLDTFQQEPLFFFCLCSSCLTILSQICNSKYCCTELEINELNPISSGRFSKPILQASPWLTQSLLYFPSSNQNYSSTDLLIQKSWQRSLSHKSQLLQSFWLQ